MSIAREIFVCRDMRDDRYSLNGHRIVQRWSNGRSATFTFGDGSVLGTDGRGRADWASGGTNPNWPRDIIEFVSPNRVYRIRKCSSNGAGASNFYEHADVIAPSAQDALAAAIDFRVTNWRLVDRFDSSDDAYAYFELLYGVEPEEVHHPRKPLDQRRPEDSDKTVIERASYLQAGARAVEDVAEPDGFADVWRVQAEA